MTNKELETKAVKKANDLYLDATNTGVDSEIREQNVNTTNVSKAILDSITNDIDDNGSLTIDQKIAMQKAQVQNNEHLAMQEEQSRQKNLFALQEANRQIDTSTEKNIIELETGVEQSLMRNQSQYDLARQKNMDDWLKANLQAEYDKEAGEQSYYDGYSIGSDLQSWFSGKNMIAVNEQKSGEYLAKVAQIKANYNKALNTASLAKDFADKHALDTKNSADQLTYDIADSNMRAIQKIDALSRRAAKDSYDAANVQVTALGNLLKDQMQEQIDMLEDTQNTYLKEYYKRYLPNLLYSREHMLDSIAFAEGLGAKSYYDINRELTNTGFGYLGAGFLGKSVAHFADSLLSLAATPLMSAYNGKMQWQDVHFFSNFGKKYLGSDLYIWDVLPEATIWDKISVDFIFAKGLESAAEIIATAIPTGMALRAPMTALVAERAAIDAGVFSNAMIHNLHRQRRELSTLMKGMPDKTSPAYLALQHQFEGAGRLLVHMRNTVRGKAIPTTATKEKILAKFGAMSANYTKASKAGLAQALATPLGLMGIDISRRMVDLINNRGPDATFMWQDFFGALAHWGADVVASATMFSQVARATSARARYLGETFDIPKKTLGQHFLLGASEEYLAETLQTYIEEQARNKYDLPSLSTILSGSYSYGPYSEEKRRITEAGAIGFFTGGALAGGAHLFNSISDTVASRGRELLYGINDALRILTDEAIDSYEQETQESLNNITSSSNAAAAGLASVSGVAGASTASTADIKQQVNDIKAAENELGNKDADVKTNNETRKGQINNEIKNDSEEAKRLEKEEEEALEKYQEAEAKYMHDRDQASKDAKDAAEANLKNIKQQRDELAEKIQKKQDLMLKYEALDQAIQSRQTANNLLNLVSHVANNATDEQMEQVDKMLDAIRKMMNAKTKEARDEAMQEFLKAYSPDGKDMEVALRIAKDGNVNRLVDKNSLTDDDKKIKNKAGKKDKNKQEPADPSSASNADPDAASKDTQDEINELKDQNDEAINEAGVSDVGSVTNEESLEEAIKRAMDADVETRRAFLQSLDPDVAAEILMEAQLERMYPNSKRKDYSKARQSYQDYKKAHATVRVPIEYTASLDDSNLQDKDTFIAKDENGRLIVNRRNEVISMPRHYFNPLTEQDAVIQSVNDARNQFQQAILIASSLQSEKARAQINELIKKLSEKNADRDTINQIINELQSNLTKQFDDITKAVNFLKMIRSLNSINGILHTNVDRLLDTIAKEVTEIESDIGKLNSLLNQYDESIQKMGTNEGDFSTGIEEEFGAVITDPHSGLLSSFFRGFKNLFSDFLETTDPKEKKTKRKTIRNVLKQLKVVVDGLKNMLESKEFAATQSVLMDSLNDRTDFCKYLISDDGSRNALVLDFAIYGIEHNIGTDNIFNYILEVMFGDLLHGFLDFRATLDVKKTILDGLIRLGLSSEGFGNHKLSLFKPVLDRIIINSLEINRILASQKNFELGSVKATFKTFKLSDLLLMTTETLSEIFSEDTLNKYLEEAGVVSNGIAYDDKGKLTPEAQEFIRPHITKIKELIINDLLKDKDFMTRLNASALSDTQATQALDNFLKLGLVLLTYVYGNSNSLTDDGNTAPHQAVKAAFKDKSLEVDKDLFDIITTAEGASQVRKLLKDMFFPQNDDTTTENQTNVDAAIDAIYEIATSVAETYLMTKSLNGNPVVIRKHIKDANGDNISVLAINKNFKNRLANDYKSDIETFMELVNQEETQTNDVAKMASLIGRMRRIPDSRRKAMIYNLQHTGHNYAGKKPQNGLLEILAPSKKFDEMVNDILDAVNNNDPSQKAFYITDKQFSEKEKTFLNLSQPDLNRILEDTNSKDNILNYQRIAYYEKIEQGPEGEKIVRYRKKYKYIYIEGVTTLANQSLRTQLFADTKEGGLNIDMIRDASDLANRKKIVSRITERQNQIGSLLSKVVAAYVVNPNSNVSHEGKSLFVDEGGKHIAPVNYSQTVYSFYDLMPNGRAFIKEAGNKMDNKLERELVDYVIPENIYEFVDETDKDGKTKRVLKTKKNDDAQQWGAKKGTINTLADLLDIANGNMDLYIGVIYGLAQAFNIDIDKANLPNNVNKETIKKVIARIKLIDKDLKDFKEDIDSNFQSFDINKKSGIFRKAVYKVYAQKINKDVKGLTKDERNAASELLKSDKSFVQAVQEEMAAQRTQEGHTLLDKTYYYNKVSLVELFKDLAGTDITKAKAAIATFKKLASQFKEEAKGLSFFAEHRGLALNNLSVFEDAVNKLEKAINDGKFDANKNTFLNALQTQNILVYMDGSATFMMENGIRMQGTTITNTVAGINSINANKSSEFEDMIAQIVYNRSVINDILESYKANNGNVAEVLKTIEQAIEEAEKTNDIYSLSMLTTVKTLMQFSKISLLSALWVTENNLSREVMKLFIQPEAYGAGVFAKLSKIAELSEIPLDNALTSFMINNFLKQGKIIVKDNNGIVVEENTIYSLINQLNEEADNKKKKGSFTTKYHLLKQQILDAFRESIVQELQTIDNTIDKKSKELEAEKNIHRKNDLKNEIAYLKKKKSFLVSFQSYYMPTGTKFKKSLDDLLFDSVDNGKFRFARDKDYRSSNELIQSFDMAGMISNIKDTLSKDVNKMKEYYENYGYTGSYITNDQLDIAKEINELRKDKTANLFFMSLKNKMNWFKSINYDDKINAFKNDYITIHLLNNGIQIVFSEKLNEEIQAHYNAITNDPDSFEKSEKTIKSLLENIVKFQINTTQQGSQSISSSDNSLIFKHTPMYLNASPLLTLVTQNNKYLIEMKEGLQNKSSRYINEAMWALLRTVYEDEYPDKNRRPTLKEALNDVKFINRFFKERNALVKRLVDDLTAESFFGTEFFMPLFSMSLSQEQKINFRNYMQSVTQQFKDNISEQIDNLFNSKSQKEQASDLITMLSGLTDKHLNSFLEGKKSESIYLSSSNFIFPDVIGLFNHNIEAVIMSISNNPHLQVYDAIVGNANNAERFRRNAWNQGFSQEGYKAATSRVIRDFHTRLDTVFARLLTDNNKSFTIETKKGGKKRLNSERAKRLFKNYDPSNKKSKLDFENMDREDMIAELERLESLIKYQINLINFYTASTVNIKGFMPSSAQYDLNGTSLIIEYKEDLELYREYIQILEEKAAQDPSYRSIINSLSRKISYNVLGDEDINVYNTLKECGLFDANKDDSINNALTGTKRSNLQKTGARGAKLSSTETFHTIAVFTMAVNNFIEKSLGKRLNNPNNSNDLYDYNALFLDRLAGIVSTMYGQYVPSFKTNSSSRGGYSIINVANLLRDYSLTQFIDNAENIKTNIREMFNDINILNISLSDNFSVILNDWLSKTDFTKKSIANIQRDLIELVFKDFAIQYIKEKIEFNRLETTQQTSVNLELNAFTLNINDFFNNGTDISFTSPSLNSTVTIDINAKNNIKQKIYNNPNEAFDSKILGKLIDYMKTYNKEKYNEFATKLKNNIYGKAANLGKNYKLVYMVEGQNNIFSFGSLYKSITDKDGYTSIDDSHIGINLPGHTMLLNLLLDQKTQDEIANRRTVKLGQERLGHESGTSTLNGSTTALTVEQYINLVMNDIETMKNRGEVNGKDISNELDALKAVISSLLKNLRNNLNITMSALSGQGRGEFVVDYDENGNPISQSIVIYADANLSTRLHELLHALTYFGGKSLSNEAKILMQGINELRMLVKQHLDENPELAEELGISHKLDYIFQDDIFNGTQEFLATFLSEAKLIAFLADFKANQMNVPKVFAGHNLIGKAINGVIQLIYGLYKLASQNLTRPQSGLEVLTKSVKKLSRLNTEEGEAKAVAEYNSKIINKLNRFGSNIINSFTKDFAKFAALNPEVLVDDNGNRMTVTQAARYFKDKISSNDAVKKAIETLNGKVDDILNEAEPGGKPSYYKIALFLLENAFFTSKNFGKLINGNPVMFRYINDQVAFIRQKLIEDTIFDLRAHLDFGFRPGTILEKAINMVNRATSARTAIDYQAEVAASQKKAIVRAMLEGSESLRKALKNKKFREQYSAGMFKLVVGQNLQDYFFGETEIDESALDDLMYHIFHATNEETLASVKGHLTSGLAKLHEANQDTTQWEQKQAAITQFIADMAMTRIIGKRNKFGNQNIELLLKQLGLNWNKEAVMELHKALTMQTILYPKQFDNTRTYDEDFANYYDQVSSVKDLYYGEGAFSMSHNELQYDIQESMKNIIRLQKNTMDRVYKQRVIDVAKAKDYYILHTNIDENIYFDEQRDLYKEIDALQRFSEDAFYDDAYQFLSYNNNITNVVIDREKLTEQEFQNTEKAFKKMGFKVIKETDTGSVIMQYDGLIDFNQHKDRRGFIFRPLSHQGRAFYTVSNGEWDSMFEKEKTALRKENAAALKTQLIEYGQKVIDSNTDPLSVQPDKQSFFGYTSTKGLAGSETIMRENISNLEFEKLVNPDLSIEQAFYEMEKIAQENQIRNFANNQIYYQIIQTDEAIKEMNELVEGDKAPILPNHTEILFSRDGDGKYRFNEVLQDKYGFSLSRQDENDFNRMIDIMGYGKDSGYILVDTRILPMLFSMNKPHLGNLATSINEQFTRESHPKMFKRMQAVQTVLRTLVKETRNNIIIRNPSLVATNFKSNVIGLIGEGVPIKEIFQSIPVYVDALKRFRNNMVRMAEVQARLNVLERDNIRDKYDVAGNLMSAEDIKEEIKELNDELSYLMESQKNNPVAPLVKQGMYSNIVEDAETGGFKWDEKLIAKITKKPNYINEFFMTESSDVYNVLGDLTRLGDFVPRVILYYHLIHKKGMTEEQALDEARERFINYNTPMWSNVMRWLDYFGFVNFVKYKFNVQYQAIRAFVNAPASAMALITMSTALEAAGVPKAFTLDSWIDESFMLEGSGPTGIATDGIGRFLSSAWRWQYVGLPIAE